MGVMMRIVVKADVTAGVFGVPALQMGDVVRVLEKEDFAECDLRHVAKIMLLLEGQTGRRHVPCWKSGDPADMLRFVGEDCLVRVDAN